jgi:hypothetical protein
MNKDHVVGFVVGMIVFVLLGIWWGKTHGIQ